MSGKKSRRKGATFENQVAKLMSAAWGIEFRRTPISGGWAQGRKDVAGDIVCMDLDYNFGYCVECKNSEGWKLESLLTSSHAWFDNWWQQTVDECPDGLQPLLVFSRNYVPIFVAARQDVLWGIPDPHLTFMWYGPCDDTDISIYDSDRIVVVTLDNFLVWEVGGIEENDNV